MDDGAPIKINMLIILLQRKNMAAMTSSTKTPPITKDNFEPTKGQKTVGVNDQSMTEITLIFLFEILTKKLFCGMQNHTEDP